MHLQTTSYAAHVALNTYYDSIVETTDSLAEALQGCRGELIAPYPSMFGNPDVEPLEYLKTIREYVMANRDAISDYSNIQNEIDNIMTLLDSTIYKLTFLK
jgi:DNA-binding ferritin-like protein